MDTVKWINICDVLIELSFLKQRITGDEKSVVYKHAMCKWSWSWCDDSPQMIWKADIDKRKFILSVWWDFKGVSFLSSFQLIVSINLNVYCWTKDNLKKSIIQKRPELVNHKGVVFHHDNAGPHTKKLLELGWDMLPYSPWLPDLVPSDFHLFHSFKSTLHSVQIRL